MILQRVHFGDRGSSKELVVIGSGGGGMRRRRKLRKGVRESE